MDIKMLQMFVAVVENHGFANAADAVHCSQPTVSNQIAALESDLGTVLFDREKRPVRLTPPGEALLTHARNILSEVEAARSSVSDFSGARRGSITLGTYPSATAGYIPKLLKLFAGAHPFVKVQLLELGGAYIAQAAIAGDVNLFLRQTTPPLSSLEFHSRPLWREKFMVLIPPDHELAASGEPIPPKVLIKHPLIVTGRYQLEAILTHPFWHALGEPPQIAFEVSQPQSLVELVRERIGIGVSTELALRVSRTDGLVVRSIAHHDAVRDVAIYWPRNRALSIVARAMRDFMLLTADVPDGTRSIRQISKSSVNHSLD